MGVDFDMKTPGNPIDMTLIPQIFMHTVYLKFVRCNWLVLRVVVYPILSPLHAQIELRSRAALHNEN